MMVFAVGPVAVRLLLATTSGVNPTTAGMMVMKRTKLRVRLLFFTPSSVHGEKSRVDLFVLCGGRCNSRFSGEVLLPIFFFLVWCGLFQSGLCGVMRPWCFEVLILGYGRLRLIADAVRLSCMYTRRVIWLTTCTGVVWCFSYTGVLYHTIIVVVHRYLMV